jgi:5-hydroxyisourate hydrolase-like protein (transthyretin family)
MFSSKKSRLLAPKILNVKLVTANFLSAPGNHPFFNAISIHSQIIKAFKNYKVPILEADRPG